jgi:nitrogen fixation protein NifZ
MPSIVRDGWVVELEGPPQFEYGQKVRSKFMVRNDGTFPGKDIGDLLVKKGEEGYVISIGTYLQQYYIYGVEFIESGFRVGMKRRELESMETVMIGGQA